VSFGKDGVVWLPWVPSHAANTWGPYYDLLRPPRRAPFTIDWKVVPRWIKYAERVWQQRQKRRYAYESGRGSGRTMWPSRHPGLVLDGWLAHWLFARGYCRRNRGFLHPVELARRDGTPDGAFLGGEDRLMPSARAIPRPRPVAYEYDCGFGTRFRWAIGLLIGARLRRFPSVAATSPRRPGVKVMYFGDLVGPEC
jgi:hypothetical protein